MRCVTVAAAKMRVYLASRAQSLYCKALIGRKVTPRLKVLLLLSRLVRRSNAFATTHIKYTRTRNPYAMSSEYIYICECNDFNSFWLRPRSLRALYTNCQPRVIYSRGSCPASRPLNWCRKNKTKMSRQHKL